MEMIETGTSVTVERERRRSRNRAIAAAHCEGKTYAAIAREHGISRARVKDIVDKEVKLDRIAAWREEGRGRGPLREGQDLSTRTMPLSVRAANCLRNLEEPYRDTLGRESGGVRTVRQLSAYGRARLLRTPNLGVVTLAEIERELARLGLELAP